MKVLVCASVIALCIPAVTLAQDMKGMDMKATNPKSTSMEMKGQNPYKATGTVKKVDKAKGTVTLAHGPVKELKWSSMTMTFGVNDKSMLEKVSAGDKVDFEFVQRGKDYVVTRVK